MKKFGLTDQEVAESKQKYGDNSMTEQAHEGFFDKLKGNLGDPMIKILIVALLINIVLSILGYTGISKRVTPSGTSRLGSSWRYALRRWSQHSRNTETKTRSRSFRKRLRALW